ncbi:MAG: glycosyltransferase family 2 protein [Armatimonadetes bacterium]|nr:glycosyltransferase family 2 protein [Armatimonadota bacterium]MDW8029149.1 glycosyltransferase family 2 protein [Armatimonadota bacterium]
MERLSVVLPAFNERGNIAPLLSEIADVAKQISAPTEVVIVDDGSIDGTFIEAEQVAPLLVPPLETITLVRLHRNFGQTVATSAGILHATGDFIVIMDADRQNDPADIPRLLAKLQEGFDVVSGWRKERKDKWTRIVPSKIANALISAATGVKVHDLGCSLRAYRSWVLQTLVREGLNHRYMPIYCAAKGAKIAEIVVNHRPRTVGQSKYGLGRVFVVLRDLPLLTFLARYGQNPYAGMAVLAAKQLGLGLICALASWWLNSLVPLWIFLLIFSQGVFLAAGFIAELLMRQGGQRLESIRQSVAEVKTFVGVWQTRGND